MDEISDQERAVLAMISANPFVGQREIADALGLARSTVAAHVVQLTRKGFVLGRGYVLPRSSRIVCIGGAVLDRKFQAEAAFVAETSNPVSGFRSLGGVARNVAENLAALGTETSLISIVGNDETGREILNAMRERGVDVSQVIVSDDLPTAEYIALIGPDRTLSVAAADMRIFDRLGPDCLERLWPHLASARWVFADCNLPSETLRSLIDRKRSARFKLAIDAVSTPKVTRLAPDLTGIDLLFLNLDEARAFLGVDASMDAYASAEALRRLGATEVVLTRGADGAVLANTGGAIRIAPVSAVPVDITGAGDAMIAATLHHIMTGEQTAAAVRAGALLGALTTETSATVHPSLSAQFLDANRHRLPL